MIYNILYALVALIPEVSPATVDTVKVHELPGITISAPIKHSSEFAEQAVSATTIKITDMESGHITEPKNLSLNIPNFIHADYGSKMTGSIYVRGIGSRMDQPAMGLYIDNVPILNKNNYDFDYYDMRRIDVLRGPQGTLYGRNTIGGVIDVHTLSPAEYQGTRAGLEYGNGNTWTARASTYQKPTERMAFSLALNHHYSDGFFTNIYDGSAADRILSESGRFKIQLQLSERLTMENILSANFVKQKGFAYSLYDEETETTSPVNHNDPCSYDRFGLTDGLIFRYTGDNIHISSVTSYQYLNDEMILDQDFQPASMFTLRQSQRENAFTQEIVMRPAKKQNWDWISGFFGFYKRNRMDAPVTFKRDGIDELILANANAGIHTTFPDADILIEEEEFPVNSSFKLPAFGLSLYHQSHYEAGRWKFTAGLRADYEYTAIKYNNATAINYRFTLTMPGYKPLPVSMSGKEHKSFFELMPKASITYKTTAGTLYATAARGYKTGGFNTQIFSDILQNKLMSAMMSDLGVYFDGYNPAYDAASVISYKPEYSWNYEAGGHFSFFKDKLLVDAALFYIDCRNQQLTVFPPGKTTGRLMSNAGRTRSVGAELSAMYRYKNFNISANYGHTNARFVQYNNGNEDFADNFVPYAPLNTISVSSGYKILFSDNWLDSMMFNVYWQGVGKIYWNESNTLSQPFYGLLSATIILKKSGYSLGLWGKNLTDTEFNTFYFKSVGNSFVQPGKSLQAGIFFNINI